MFAKWDEMRGVPDEKARSVLVVYVRSFRGGATKQIAHFVNTP